MGQQESPWYEVGSCSLNPANPPTLNWTMGCVSDTVPTRNGAGDYSFTLTEAIDSTECDFHAQQQEAAAASGLTSYGLAHTSDTVKRITILREAAMGGASALTDVTGPVVIRFYKRAVRT